MAETTPEYPPVDEVLECTICLDVPASPIHNCSNGHIMCGICKDKVNKCGLCESKDFEVSVVLERISRQLSFKIKCPNYEAGCRKWIAATEIKDHANQKCYYRNAVCCQNSGQVCNNVSIPLKDFAHHLKNKHNFKQANASVVRAIKSFTNKNNMSDKDCYWPTDSATKRGQWFLVHSCVSKDVAYFWTTVLGDKEEALKHTCQLTFEPLPGMIKRSKCSWTIPVLPYHDYPTFKDSMRVVSSFPVELLKKYCTEKVGAENTVYGFVITCTKL